MRRDGVAVATPCFLLFTANGFVGQPIFDFWGAPVTAERSAIMESPGALGWGSVVDCFEPRPEVDAFEAESSGACLPVMVWEALVGELRVWVATMIVSSRGGDRRTD